VNGQSALTRLDVRRMQPDIETGERLCGAFEAFKSTFPDSIITIERVFLLVAALSSHEEIDLAQCVDCGQAAIIDLLQVAPQSCENCGCAFRSDTNSPYAHAARMEPKPSLPDSATSDRSLHRSQRRHGCSPSTSSRWKSS
jgi:hypothetical protein